MKKKLIYCDMPKCNKKVMPITDRDFNEGKTHVFHPAEYACEPPISEGEDGIEIIVRAQRIRVNSKVFSSYSYDYHLDTDHLRASGVNSVDLCRDCMIKLLKEVLPPDGSVELYEEWVSQEERRLGRKS